MALLAPYCDIAERLADIPWEAKIRGVYFKSIQLALARRGLESAVRTACERTTYSFLSLYPARDYLLLLAHAGALATSPDRVHEGMAEISQGNARYFAESLLGRGLIRVLAGDPVRILQQGLAAKRQVSNYGSWSLIQHGPRSVEIVHEEEYVWIESALLGAARGTLESCGVIPRITVQLRDRYNGSLHMEW